MGHSHLRVGGVTDVTKTLAQAGQVRVSRVRKATQPGFTQCARVSQLLFAKIQTKKGPPGTGIEVRG